MEISPLEIQNEIEDELTDNNDCWIKLSKRQNRIKNFLLNFKITMKDDSMECMRGILSINKHFRSISYTAELYYIVMFKMLMDGYEPELTRKKIDILVDNSEDLKDFKLTDDDMKIYKMVGLDTVYTNIIYRLGI